MLKMKNLSTYLDFKLYFFTKLLSKPSFLLTPFLKLYNQGAAYIRITFFNVSNRTIEEKKNKLKVNDVQFNSTPKELLTQILFKIRYFFGSNSFQNLSLYFR